MSEPQVIPVVLEGGSITPVSRLQIASAVDSFPQASWDRHPVAPATQTVKAMSSRFLQVAEQAQNRMFEAGPPVSLTLQAGDSFAFSGRLAREGARFGHGVVGSESMAQGEAAALSALATHVYMPATKPNGDPDGIDILSRDNFLLREKGDNIAKRLLSIMDALDKAWERKAVAAWKGVSGNPSRQAYLELIHEANREPMAVLRAILEESSEAVLDGLGKVPDLAFQKHFNRYLLQLYCTRTSGDYLANLTAICRAFGLAYHPDTGSYGALFPKDKGYYQGEGTAMDLSGVEFNIMPGGSSAVPYTRVAVSGLAWPLLARHAVGTTGQSIIAFPQEVEAEGIGRLLELPPPPWMGGVSSSRFMVGDPKGRKGCIPGGSSPQVKQDATRVKNLYTALLGAKGPLLTYLRRAYIDFALAGSSVSLSIPPRSTGLTVGTRYTVKLDEGAVFTGTLASVMHSFATFPSREASTRLDFSHVEAGSFRLPGV